MSGEEFPTPEEKAEGKSEVGPQGKRNSPGSVGGTEILALRFETHRARLRAVAHRTLGSLAEADDAVQEAWLRLSRADTSEIANLGGWPRSGGPPSSTGPSVSWASWRGAWSACCPSQSYTAGSP